MKPDAWLYRFMGKEEAEVERAVFQVKQEEEPLFSGSTIQEEIEERIEEIKQKESDWKEKKNEVDELEKTENVARISELENLQEEFKQKNGDSDGE